MSRRRKSRQDIPGTVWLTCMDRYHGGAFHREAVARLSDDALTVVSRIREHPRADGGVTWKIACRCGLDVQVERGVLAELAAAMFKASPGATRVDVPLGVLQRAAGDRLRPLDAERARSLAEALVKSMPPVVSPRPEGSPA